MSKPVLVYILGPSYSGSTLLTFLLARHPQIATIGELKATKMGDIENYDCSCGQRILDCDFWKQVGVRCAERNVEFSVRSFDTELHATGGFADRLVRAAVRGRVYEAIRSLVLGALPGAAGALRESVRRNYDISQAVCEVQDRKIFLDGSKSPARLLHFQRSGLWDVRVIDLQRDGRGVSNSNRKHMQSGITAAIKRWLQITREVGDVRRWLPDEHHIRISYEDLCKKPEATLEAITSALGMTPMPDVDGGLMQGEHHILGNAMRLKSIAEIRFDEGWRKQLSERELQEFEMLAGDLNRELGYE